MKFTFQTLIDKLNIPKWLLPWITYTQFLTKRLEAITGNTRIAVINEGIISSRWWDRYKLHIGFEPVFVREIIAYAHTDKCWYAQTIIPNTTYTKHYNLFSELGTITLGDLIFGDYQITRNSLTIYEINHSNIEFYFLDKSLLNTSKQLWARISEFLVKQEDKFYLLEIFLPDLEKYS